MFYRHKKTYSKIYVDASPNIAEATKKSEGGGIILPAGKLYSAGSAIKTVWDQWREKHTGEWNRMEMVETDPHMLA